MFNFISNDTVALIFLGIIAIVALILNISPETIASGVVGAFGGYIGRHVSENKKEDDK